MPLIHYLIAYDHRRQRLLRARPYDNATAAVEAYNELEQRYGGNAGMEIVLISADSLETIRQTHGNYFDGEMPAEDFAAAAG